MDAPHLHLCTHLHICICTCPPCTIHPLLSQGIIKVSVNTRFVSTLCAQHHCALHFYIVLHLTTLGLRGVAGSHLLHYKPIHALNVQYPGGVYTAASHSWRGKKNLEIKDGIVVFQVMENAAVHHAPHRARRRWVPFYMF